MNVCLYVELNVFCLGTLGLLLFNQRSRGAGLPDEVLFRALVRATMLILVCDAGQWLLNGRLSGGARTLNLALSALYFILTGAIVSLWLFYADFKLNDDLGRLRRRALLYALPALVIGLLAVCALWDGRLFTVDAQNLYRRGPLYWVQAGLSWAGLLHTVAMALVRARREVLRAKRTGCWSIAMFVAFPMLGSILQTLFYGIPLTWVGAAFSLLILFINLQNSQISLDALTGANNRGQFNRYLATRLSSLRASDTLALVFIDVDGFKAINDTCGHSAGDAVLVRVAGMLKLVCGRCSTGRTGCFLARYGGDEFAIVCAGADPGVLPRVKQAIDEGVHDLNAAPGAPYGLSLSVGSAVYDRETMHGPDALIVAADAAMYEIKRQRHGNARRWRGTRAPGAAKSGAERRPADAEDPETEEQNTP